MVTGDTSQPGKGLDVGYVRQSAVGLYLEKWGQSQNLVNINWRAGNLFVKGIDSPLKEIQFAAPKGRQIHINKRPDPANMCRNASLMKRDHPFIFFKGNTFISECLQHLFSTA